MFKNRTGRAALAACLLSLVVGCAEVVHEAAKYEGAATSPSIAPQSALAGRAGGITGGGAGVPMAVWYTGLDRKIIYNATVELVVEEFSGMPERVVALVKKYDAYVASSGLGGSSGENRRGSWTIRVPVVKFEEFINATKGLGELVNVSTRSQDVSEEYYDVEARIRNKTKEEERLLKLLEERPGKLEDVIAIERELLGACAKSWNGCKGGCACWPTRRRWQPSSCRLSRSGTMHHPRVPPWQPAPAERSRAHSCAQVSRGGPADQRVCLLRLAARRRRGRHAGLSACTSNTPAASEASVARRGCNLVSHSPACGSSADSRRAAR